MRIRGEKLRTLAEKEGLTVEQLGEAVDRTGLEGERAVKAVRNWMWDPLESTCRHASLSIL